MHLSLDNEAINKLADEVSVRLAERTEIRARLDSYYKEGEERAKKFAERAILNRADSELRAILEDKLKAHGQSIAALVLRDFVNSDELRRIIRKELRSIFREDGQ